MYLATEKEWKECADILSTQSAIGLDSEFTGVDFSLGQSCVNRAKIHVWSVAIQTDNLHPRGYHRAIGCVLPVSAIETFRPILENPSIVKAIHNAPVDVHAFYNSGVDIVGVVNTLSLCRWALPGRSRYNLDDICNSCLGSGKADSFNDICRIEKFRTEIKSKVVKSKVCMTCGDPAAGGFICRRRKYPHIRTEVEHITTEEKVYRDGWEYIDQHIIIPGHPLWERYEEYAMVDAVRAIEIYDFCNRVDKQTEVLWYHQ